MNKRIEPTFSTIPELRTVELVTETSFREKKSSRSLASWVMMIIGYGWASWGGVSLAALFIFAPENAEINNGVVMVIIFFMLLFVLPGLIVGGIGSSMGKSK